MIRLVDGDEYSSSRISVIYADTQEEVPETGAATVVQGYSGTIMPGSVIYTKTLKIAVLASDDTWNWQE